MYIFMYMYMYIDICLQCLALRSKPSAMYRSNRGANHDDV